MPMPPQYKTSKGYLGNAEHVDLIKKIQTQDPLPVSTHRGLGQP